MADLINYNQIVRNLTEWTATSGNDSFDQTSISEGLGGTYTGTLPANVTGIKPIRPACIQGISSYPNDYAYCPNQKGSAGNYYTIRRYNIQFALGLFTQGKLIPTKFMASQLAVELTLATEAQCIHTTVAQSVFSRIPTYKLANVNLIPEILEFDASYGTFF